MRDSCPICNRPLCRTTEGDSTDYEQRARCYKLGYARERERADLGDARNEGLKDLLRRLSEWDHMRSAGDGLFWRREISNVLELPHA